MHNSPEVRAFRDAEEAYLRSYGLGAQELYVPLRRLGVQGRCLAIGDGPPLVFMHGGGGLGSGWAPLLPHLTGYRCLLLDRPGCGLSDFVDYKGADLRGHAVDFLADMFDALDVSEAPIVANSMGALWSMWFAIQHPGRVERLSSMGCPALILETSAPGGMRLLGVPGLNRLMMRLEPPSPKQVRTLWARMGHDPDVVITPEMVELMVRLGQLPTYEKAWLSLLENVLPFSRVNRTLSLGGSELGAIEQPVLYLWGREDPFGSLDVARRAQEGTPDSELHVVGTGHLPWLDDPETCGSLTGQFLRRTS